MRVFAAAVLSLVVAGTATAAATVDRNRFRYVRELEAPGSGPVRFEPDGLLYGHARPDFGDLRILDADGRPVPWRELPVEEPASPIPVTVLDRGRSGRFIVALLDLGPRRRIHDRIDLAIAGRRFVGRVTIFGSDDRRAFVRLSTTVVYDVAGAEGSARSTAVVFPPSDFRYLRLRATGVPAIVGATVSGTEARNGLRRVSSNLRVRLVEGRTRVTVDLGHRGVPVEELEIDARTPRYDRDIEIQGSDDGRTFSFVATARIIRFPGSRQPALRLDSRFRYLRIEVRNGDDPPLQGFRVSALARPRPVLAAGGYRLPYRLLYGSSRVSPPRYDFARLPLRTLGPAQRGRLTAEATNPDFRHAPDARSFAARHPGVITSALVAAALAVTGAAFLALRRRPERP